MKPNNERAIGKYYEDQAANFLMAKGYKVICRNFYFQGAEIDLITLAPENILSFIEVKFRQFKKAGQMFVHPFFAIDLKKQQNLTRAAQGFLAENLDYQSYYCRYDIVAFIKEPQHDKEKSTIKVEHLENAFQIM